MLKIREKKCRIVRPEINDILKIGVCKGRHEMPCNFYVYEQTIEDPTDVTSLDGQAEEFFKRIETKEKEIEIFVTGLTVALISILKVAVKKYDHVVLMHYDVKTATYYKQIVK